MPLDSGVPPPSPSADPGTPPPSPAPADWRTHVTDELKADPVVADFTAKSDYKDIPSLIKGMAHAQKRMGTATFLPGKDAKPEEVAAFKQRLYDAGVIPAPPKDVAAYNIKAPEKLADGVRWNDDLAKNFGETLLKHGASPELAKDMLALYEKALTGTMAALKTTKEENLAKLKAEHGAQFDEKMEMAERLAQGIFDKETYQFFDETGIGRDTRFLNVLMKLAPLAMQDSSFMDSIPVEGGQMTGEEVTAELTAIMTDPKHAMYEGYRRRDPAVNRYIDSLYRRAYGSGQQVGA